MEKLKNFIKDNRKVERLFYTGLTEKSIKQKREFIENHFTYYTMNSWNREKSIFLEKYGLHNVNKADFKNGSVIIWG